MPIKKKSKSKKIEIKVRKQAPTNAKQGIIANAGQETNTEKQRKSLFHTNAEQAITVLPDPQRMKGLAKLGIIALMPLRKSSALLDLIVWPGVKHLYPVLLDGFVRPEVRPPLNALLDLTVQAAQKEKRVARAAFIAQKVCCCFFFSLYLPISVLRI